MQRECVIIDGVKYTAQPEATGEIRIVILQRGWVAVGRWKQADNECSLENASIIRKWGTSKGLGEIAADGPTKNTVLDPCATMRFHKLAVVATIDCVESKWATYCS